MSPKAPAKMKRSMVFLRPDQTEALRKVFEETGMRPAEAVRRAVDMFLEARKGKGGR
jgi:hypothetical protein